MTAQMATRLTLRTFKHKKRKVSIDTQTNPKMGATGIAKETVRITIELQYFTACYKNHTRIK